MYRAYRRTPRSRRVETDAMTRFFKRMIGAALLRRETYEQVEADPGATVQALMVVVLASCGGGVGLIGLEPSRLPALIALTAVGVAGWVAWALLTFMIGTRWFPEPQTRADAGELLRTVGFAQSPGIIRIVGLVGGFGPWVTGLVALWTLATMVVAVRQALDYRSTLRALGVCVTGWAIALGMFWVVGIFFATPVS